MRRYSLQFIDESHIDIGTVAVEFTVVAESLEEAERYVRGEFPFMRCPIWRSICVREIPTAE